MTTTEHESRLHRVQVYVCGNCLNEVPGQCHEPGCLFIRFTITETPQPLKYMTITPRVFLEGDTVPAGVCVLTEGGDVRWLDDTADCCCDLDPGETCEECSYDVGNGNLGALVEVLLPDHSETVSTDHDRRRAHEHQDR